VAGSHPIVRAQAKRKPKTPSPKTQQKTVVPQLPFLSQHEQALFDEINYARANPTTYIKFLEQYKSYYKEKLVRLPDGHSFVTNEGVVALDEAIEFLKTLKPLTPLLVSKGLALSAKLHLDDLQKSGGSGHRGTDGSKPEDRFSRFGIWQDSVGENIVYDSRTARNDVIGLIIDDGVATRGHRKNLFKPVFKVIGISSGKPIKDKTMCVITFAGGFTEEPQRSGINSPILIQ